LFGLININIEIKGQGLILKDAFEIAMKYNLTVYDALYIALAKNMDATLVTLDTRQYGVCRQEGIKCRLIALP